MLINNVYARIWVSVYLGIWVSGYCTLVTGVSGWSGAVLMLRPGQKNYSPFPRLKRLPSDPESHVFVCSRSSFELFLSGCCFCCCCCCCCVHLPARAKRKYPVFNRKLHFSTHCAWLHSLSCHCSCWVAPSQAHTDGAKDTDTDRHTFGTLNLFWVLIFRFQIARLNGQDQDQSRPGTKSESQPESDSGAG